MTYQPFCLGFGGMIGGNHTPTIFHNTFAFQTSNAVAQALKLPLGPLAIAFANEVAAFDRSPDQPDKIEVIVPEAALSQTGDGVVRHDHFAHWP